MKVIVYGTLKNGEGNNRLLREAHFEEERVVDGYKLYFSYGNVGFPVATPDDNSKLVGELWDIGDRKDILARLDQLEGVPFMYERVEVEPDVFMYVGNQNGWDFNKLNECPNENNIYTWVR